LTIKCTVKLKKLATNRAHNEAIHPQSGDGSIFWALIAGVVVGLLLGRMGDN